MNTIYFQGFMTEHQSFVFFKRSVYCASLASGFAFLILAITYPVILYNLVSIEAELDEKRVQLNIVSNNIWNDLMLQGRTTRLARGTSNLERFGELISLFRHLCSHTV